MCSYTCTSFVSFMCVLKYDAVLFFFIFRQTDQKTNTETRNSRGKNTSKVHLPYDFDVISNNKTLSITNVRPFDCVGQNYFHFVSLVCVPYRGMHFTYLESTSSRVIIIFILLTLEKSNTNPNERLYALSFKRAQWQLWKKARKNVYRLFCSALTISQSIYSITAYASYVLAFQ